MSERSSQETEKDAVRDALRLGLVEHIPATRNVTYCNNNLTYAGVEDGNCSSCGGVIPPVSKGGTDVRTFAPTD